MAGRTGATKDDDAHLDPWSSGDGDDAGPPAVGAVSMACEELARDIMAARDDWRSSMGVIGEHIRRLRKLAGLSQQRLAQVAGVSQAAMSRIEAGRPTGQLAIFRIGRALNELLLPDCDALLGDDARRILHALDTLAPATTRAPAPTMRNRRAEELLRLFQRASETDQDVLLAVARALVD